MIKTLDKRQKLIIKVLICIVLIICIISIIIFFSGDNIKKISRFHIPNIEENAINGKPVNIPKEYIYQEAKVNDNYIVYLCAAPVFKNKILTIYFTSSEVNKGLIKIRVLDSQKNIIGESGLINPNSYIKDIKLNKEINDKEMITIKVMHYEKETYYSLGEIMLSMIAKKVDS